MQQMLKPKREVGKEEEWLLEGKYVLLRAFESGELLSITHLEEWGAESKHIDAFDVMWFVLYPNPPNIKKSNPTPSMARYPLRFSTEQRGYAKMRSEWDLTSVSTRALLKYKGKTIIKGGWRDIELSGAGEFSGEIESLLQGGIPYKHRGQLTRTLCYESQKKRCQKQEFTYSLEQLP